MGAITRAITSWLTGTILGTLSATTGIKAEYPALGLFVLSSAVDYFTDENNEMVVDILRGAEASSMAVIATELANVKNHQVELWEEAPNEAMPG